VGGRALALCLSCACGASCSASHAGGAGGDGGPAEAAARPSYDAGRDFSANANPNGAWRYGYTAGAALVAADFQLDTIAVAGDTISFWHPADGQAAYYPYVAANITGATAVDPTGSWAVRPGEIAMEASPTGQYSVVQLVAPEPGSYRLEADFAGVHTRLSSTDVHVLLGDAALLDAVIDGYGGDPSFRAVEGQSPTATLAMDVAVSPGDVLTFAVGVGPNGTNFNDTTGLVARLTPR